MARWRYLFLPILLAAFGCTSQRAPATFLHTESERWNDSMKERVDVDLTDVPLGSLGSRAPFREITFTLDDLDPDYRITLQAQRVTRRQALWMLADKYGLSMSAADGKVIITPRQLRRENKPVN